MDDPHGNEWRTLLASLGVAEAASQQVYADLLVRYTGATRHYHNLAHVHAVLDVLASVRHLATNYAALVLAVWFHDAIYAWDSAENERLSAELARKTLTELAVPSALVAEVVRLILLTQHKTLPDSADINGQLIVDADLAALAVSNEQFVQNAYDIRHEFQRVPPKIYYQERVRLLRGLFNRPRLFHTPCLHDQLEAQARSNIEREIARIGRIIETL